MSPMTSTARAGARALNRPITETPRLRVVTGDPLRHGGAAFGILCASLLAIGLIGLLLLNTSLAQGSFTLHDLRTTSDQLADTQGTLNQSLEALSSPANLAKKASSMGMVPAQSAAFLRLSDGKVIGVAQPAAPGQGFTVVGTTAPAAPKTVVTRPATASAKPSPTQPAASATRPAKPVPVSASAVKPTKG